MREASQSNSAQSSPHESWWERKLTLLVAGFILTGLIGPWLQFVQKKLEWQRQISFQAFNRKLTAMQHAREELTKVYVTATLIMEQFEHQRTRSRSSAKNVPSKPPLHLPDSSRQNRLRETATLFATADIFPDPVRIKVPLEKLVAAWKVLADTEQEVRTAPGLSHDEGLSDLFDRAKQQFNENYDLVRHAIEAEIGEFEDANRNRSF